VTTGERDTRRRGSAVPLFEDARQGYFQHGLDHQHHRHDHQRGPDRPDHRERRLVPWAGGARPVPLPGKLGGDDHRHQQATADDQQRRVGGPGHRREHHRGERDTA
jgi:hypothetical protein